MTSDQLFAAMPTSLAIEIIESISTADKPLYKSVVEAVAQARKVRGVFLMRQPRGERHPLMAASLARPHLRLVGDNLLRTWLLKKHSALLTDFLDGLKISHDNGVVQDLPATIEDAALNNCVETVLGKHPPLVVALYLHAFNSMNETRWTNLDALLQTDQRLRLSQSA